MFGDICMENEEVHHIYNPDAPHGCLEYARNLPWNFMVNGMQIFHTSMEHMG